MEWKLYLSRVAHLASRLVFIGALQVSVSGFHLNRRDRGRHGGGLVVYVAEHLSHNRLNDSNIIPANVNIEANWFELYQPKTKKILLGASYRSPNLDASVFIDSLEKMLNGLGFQ